MIIETIEKTKDVLGLSRALKAFGISYQQFYAWKRKVRCSMSPVVLCRKLNPKQRFFNPILIMVISRTNS
jgi:hypothetical protein